jgi:hypothetical protein
VVGVIPKSPKAGEGMRRGKKGHVRREKKAIIKAEAGKLKKATQRKTK